MKRDSAELDGIMESFMMSMLKNLPDMIYVKNKDLIYVGASQSFAEMVGLSDAEELVGKTDQQLFGDSDLARRFMEDDQRLLASHQPMKAYIEPFCTYDDGSRGYCQTSKFPIFDGDGKVIGLYGVSRDVTLEYKAKLSYEQELNALFKLPDNALAAALFDVTNWRLVDLRLVGDFFHTAAKYDSADAFIEVAVNTVVDDEEIRYFYQTFSPENLTTMFEGGRRHMSLEYRRRLPGDIIHWVKVDLHFLIDPVNGNLCVVWILRDIDKQKKEELAITRAAEWDALTNVYNREATMKHIRGFLQGEGASGIHWLFMIDVDNFKLVNDTFGHQTGDETLEDIATVIRSAFCDKDIVGRVGGDEFFVLMKDVKQRQEVMKRASQLVESLQYVCAENHERVELSCSVGISCYSGTAKTLERLYAEADSALYRAKQAGKNRYAFAEVESVNSSTDIPREQEIANTVHLRTLLENMDADMFQTEMAADGVIRVTYSSHNLFFAGAGDSERTSVRGENIWSIILSEDREPLKAVICEASLTGAELDHTCRIYNSAGQIEWRHIRGTSLPDSGDGVHRMIHVATDITKQKHVEAELREKDSIIDFAMRNTDVNLWYFNYETAECQLTKSCQKAHEMSEVESLSNFPECLFEIGYVREDCIESLRTAYEHLRETGESTEFDTWFRKADGTGWWCERDMLSPLLGADGRVTRGIGIGKDVTAEKELAEKFHAFQSYRFLAEKNTLASVRMNLTTGWCGDYVSSSSFAWEVMNADTVDEFFQGGLDTVPTREEAESLPPLSRQYLLDVFAGGETSVQLECRCQMTDGSPVWLRAVIDIMKNPSNGDIEALYYAFDIDYEKNMKLIVDELLIADYEFLGLIDVVTGRIMVFGRDMEAPGMARNGGLYEEEMRRVYRSLILEEYYEEGIRTMNCANVMKELEKSTYFSCSFPARDFAQTKAGRKQWKFGYLDTSKSKILIARTDITNIYTAERDPLTGLYNREAFYRRTKAVLAANQNRQFLIVRFDIDRFKAYNDVYGVPAGDKLLAGLARALRKRKRPELTIFGRLEADHFVFLLPAESFQVFDWTADQMEFFDNEALGYRLTSSVGIYEVIDHDMDVSLMCDRALLALRTVKDSYTNKTAWYDESLRDQLMREQTMIDEMEHALRDGQFVVFFQPLINYTDHSMIGAEALVRWSHPKQGLIPPDAFIPLFEKNGFILRLDAYVWEKSCQYLRSWLDQGDLFAPVPVSVNISRCDLYDLELCDRLHKLIEKYQLPYSLLKLEITESAYMDDPAQLIDVVSRLRSGGFTVEMDDFGSGYSSLNMLKDVPVDVLKLDTRFLSESEHNVRATTILSSIIHMARELNLSVIAEGVETQTQADYLNSLSCINMQGYYFGRPMPVVEFEQLIALQRKGENG